MSTFIESQHPRVATGQFTEKVNTAPAAPLDAPVEERPAGVSTIAYAQRNVLAELRMQIADAEKLAGRDLAITHLREQFPWASKLHVTFDYHDVKVLPQMDIVGEDGQIFTTNGHWVVDENGEPVPGRTGAQYANLQEAHACITGMRSDAVRLLDREGQLTQDRVLFSLDLSKPAPDVDRIGELLDSGLPAAFSSRFAQHQIASDAKHGGMGDLGISGWEATELARGADPDAVDELERKLADAGTDFETEIVETAAYTRFRESVAAHVDQEFTQASYAALDELVQRHLKG